MNWRRTLPYVALVLAVLLTYANVYQNQFFYDDEFLILKNSLLRDWSGLWRVFLTSSTGGSGGVDSFYRPMQNLLYVLVFQTFGLSLVAFHLLNISIHAANSVLIFSLGKKLRFSHYAAFLAALLWSVHPMHVEAVTYMSATADSLYTFFILLGLNLYVNGRLWALVAMLFALLSKESAVVFPALAFALTFFLEKKRWSPRTFIKTLPYWALAFAYMIARKTFLNFDNTYQFYRTANVYTENIWYRILTFLATLPSYAKVLLWPFDLHFDRSFSVFVSLGDTPVLLGMVLIVLAICTLVYERRSERPVGSLAVLWFAAAHTPHSGILLPVNSLFLEHWLYLTTIGLFLWIGSGLAQIPKRLSLIIVFLITGFWSYMTWMQSEFWQSPITFYERVIQYEPNVSRVHNNLAMAYVDNGQFELATEHYKKAIELYDIYPQTHHNLALVYVHQGKIAEAKAEFERALALDADFFQSSAKLAEIYKLEGDLEKAKTFSERASQSAAKRGGTL